MSARRYGSTLDQDPDKEKEKEAPDRDKPEGEGEDKPEGDEEESIEPPTDEEKAELEAAEKGGPKHKKVYEASGEHGVSVGHARKLLAKIGSYAEEQAARGCNRIRITVEIF